jgi:hypothetical protein
VQGRVLIEKQEEAEKQVIQPSEDAVARPEEMQSHGFSQNERLHEVTVTSSIEAEEVKASKAAGNEADGVKKRRHKRRSCTRCPLNPHAYASKTAKGRNWARRHALGSSATAKWCTVCLLDKDLSDYTSKKASSFGRVSICKSCIYSRSRGARPLIHPAEDAVGGFEEMQSPGPNQDGGPHDDELTVTEEDVEEEKEEKEKEEEQEEEEEEEELWMVQALASLVKEAGQQQTYPIQCPCGSQERSGYMLSCEGCRVWLHG